MSGLADSTLCGRYHLERLIGSGGMAQVWEATDLVLGRRVAVKVLHPHLAVDDALVARFRQEAVAAARLSHPGHRRRLRHLLRRGQRGHRDGAARRLDAAPAPRRARSARRRDDGADRAAPARRARGRAPRRAGAPRRQAVEHPVVPRRSGEDRRLRDREGRRPDRADPGGHPRRHRHLPGARAAARRRGRRPHRPVLARDRALRVPDRPGALPGRDRRRGGPGPAALRPGRPASRARRRARPAVGRRSCGCCRRDPDQRYDSAADLRGRAAGHRPAAGRAGAGARCPRSTRAQPTRAPSPSPDPNAAGSSPRCSSC